MALQVWLPLNGDLHNQGLFQLPALSYNSFTSDTNGKIGNCCSGRGVYHLTNDFLANTWSICTWVKSPAWSQYNDIILCKNTDSASSYQFYFSIVNGTSLHLGINSTSMESFTFTFATDTWYHVAATFDGTNYKIYINGQEKKSGTTTVSQTTEMNNLSINCRSANASGTSQTGDNSKRLNDVRIYDHALSAKEVEEISKGLIQHYKLDHNGLGGENILSNSTGYDGNTNWTGSITADYENGQPYLIAKRVNTTSTGRTFCYHTAITSLVSSWVPGESFTISGYYKVPSSETQDVVANMFIRWTQSSSSNTDTDTGFNTSNVIKDTWIRFEKTFTVPAGFASGKTVNFYLSAFSRGLATVYWKNIKLEKGDRATGWSPAKVDSIYPDNYDTTIYDCSGFTHDQVITGALEYQTPSPRYSCATVFNANNGYSSCPHIINNDTMLNAFTISAWIYRLHTDATEQYFYCGPVRLYYYTNFSIRIQWNATNADGTSSINTWAPSNVISTNTWHHITFTFLEGTMTYYLDGVSKGTSTRPPYLKGNIGSTALLGQSLKGTLSDVRFYTTALTAAQVKELYNTSMSIDVNGNIHARELVE